MAAIEEADALLISTGTVAEAPIVAAQRNVGEKVAELIANLGFEIVSVDGGIGSQNRQCLSPLGQGQSPRLTQLWRLLCL
jgi:uncharacterized protein with PIN domain